MAVLMAPAGVINTYGTLDDLKARLGILDTSQDLSLWAVLHSASRAVEGHCGRRFFVQRATRVFDVSDWCSVLVPDVTAIHVLRVDRDGDRVYEETLDPDDYELRPLNAAPLTPSGMPFYLVVPAKAGTRCPMAGTQFPVGRSRIQIDADWGYRAHWHATGATLAAGVSSSAATLTVSETDGILPGHTLNLDGEQVFVRQVTGSDLAVARGVNGTPAASQTQGEGVLLYMPPAEVVAAALLLSARAWKRKDDAFGPAAAGDYGAIRVVPRLDPDIEGLLAPFRKMAV